MQSSCGCFEEWQLPVISGRRYSFLAVARLAAVMPPVTAISAAVCQVIVAMATAATMSLAMEMPSPTL